MRNRELYPTNWEELAWECKSRAGWHCEHCGLPHGVEVVNQQTGVVSTVVLSAAHLDHDPWNPAPRLAALCRSCHGRYDYSWQQRQRWLELEHIRHQVLVERWIMENS